MSLPEWLSGILSQQSAKGTSLAFCSAAKRCHTSKRGVIPTEIRRVRLECEGAWALFMMTPIVNLAPTFSKAKLKTVAEDAMCVSILADEF